MQKNSDQGQGSSEPTATSKDPKAFASSSLDRELDPQDSDSAGNQTSSVPLSCFRGRSKRRRLRVRFQPPTSPVLFSSDKQAVPKGEEE